MVRNSQCEMPVSWKGTRQVQIDLQQAEGAQSIRIRLEEARLAPFAWTLTTTYAWDFLCRFNEEKNCNGLPRVGLKTDGDLGIMLLLTLFSVVLYQRSLMCLWGMSSESLYDIGTTTRPDRDPEVSGVWSRGDRLGDQSRWRGRIHSSHPRKRLVRCWY